ncbi:Protein of unknown function [Paenibacillus algorifonticola]|uniref:DUF3024 domain-containing protein n=1 Tax=Paenibacillus algorifonticola TaxID=684063 RepID=A0A1I2BXF3_9BACL|nr:DUF3024 domain-containing protein [Paenibacillus algorifonticola]SFE60642.1 Protein of unknown function [Paenibacillus algorifonticola]
MDPFTIRRMEKILDGYIHRKIPPDVRSAVRLTYEWEGDRLTLTEELPDFENRKWTGAPIVQFQWKQNQWHVYATDSNGGWKAASAIAPNPHFEQQLEQVEIDQEGIFWIS